MLSLMPPDCRPAVMLLPMETYRRNIGSLMLGGLRLSSLRQLETSGRARSSAASARLRDMEIGSLTLRSSR